MIAMLLFSNAFYTISCLISDTHTYNVGCCCFFILKFLFSFASRIFVHRKLHPRNIAHAKDSVNVDQKAYAAQDSLLLLLLFKVIAPAIMNWKNVCIRMYECMYNRMKEWDTLEYAIFVAHLDTHCQTRTSYMMIIL